MGISPQAKVGQWDILLHLTCAYAFAHDTYSAMPRKHKTVGQLLAEIRWKKATPEQRAEQGKRMTDARKAKKKVAEVPLDE